MDRFAGLDRSPQRRKLTLSAHLNSSKVKSKSNFSWLSSVTRRLGKCKSSPCAGICELMGIWSRHTEVVGQVDSSPSPRRAPGSLLTPFNKNLHYASILLSLWPPNKNWNLLILFPLQSFSRIWVQSHHNVFLPFLRPSNIISPTCRKGMPLPVLCVHADQET